MTEEVDQKQRVLKIIVIVLGIAIIVCIGVIIVTIAMRASGKGERANAPAAMSAQVAPAKVLGNVDVPIPYAAKVVQVTGGAAGVGRATNNSVVANATAIFVIDFLVGWLYTF